MIATPEAEVKPKPRMGRPPGISNKGNGRPKRTKLTSQQRKAIELLLLGRTCYQIADVLEISQNTINDWRKRNPLFRQALQDALETLDQGALIDVRRLVKKAYEEIEGLLEDPNPSIRLGAARLTLEAHSRVVQQMEEREAMKMLEERLEKVQAIAQSSASPQLPPAEQVVEAEIVVDALDHALTEEVEAGPAEQANG